MPRHYQFYLPSIMCGVCTTTSCNILSELKKPKISNFYIDVVENQLIVVIDDDCTMQDNKIRKAIQEKLNEAGIECHETYPTRTYWIKGSVSLLLGITFLTLMFLSSGMSFILIASLLALGSLIVFLIGLKDYINAIKKLIKTKNFSMDFLFMISTLVAVGASISSLFVPGLCLMLDAAFFIFAFRYFGSLIEIKSKNKIFDEYCSLKKIPTEVIKENSTQKCNIKDIKPGDIILISPGETIPLDGRCLDENTYVYKTIHTGRSSPQKVLEGEELLSGMEVASTSSVIKMQVTNDSQHSYLARVRQNLENTRWNKQLPLSPANKILNYGIPSLLIVTIISGVIVAIFFPPVFAIYCVIALLVSVCPCVLGFISPLISKIGLAQAQSQNIYFKSGQDLQNAAEIDTVVFDLNGTLTQGEPHVCELELNDDSFSEDLLWQYFSILEEKSAHPSGQAILEYSKNKNRENKDFTVSELEYLPKGVKARINGELFLIGNSDFIRDHHIPFENLKTAQSKQKIFFSSSTKIIATIVLEDPLRRDAKWTIRKLKAHKKEIYLCTGADLLTAENYASQLGIEKDHIRASCLPHLCENSKTNYIEELKKKGKVAMIGDAKNDANAIAESHFGIAICSKSVDADTQKEAGAIIKSDSLKSLFSTFLIAEESVKKMKRDLILSLLYNLTTVVTIGGILLGLGFMLNPAIGVALMVLQVGLVFLSSFHFKKQLQKKLNEIEKPETEKLPQKASPSYSETLRLLPETRECSVGQEPQPREKQTVIKATYPNQERTVSDSQNREAASLRA